MGVMYSPLDMKGNDIKNWILEYLASAPNGLTRGRVYYDATLGPVWYNGTTVRPFDPAKLTDGSIPDAALATNFRARANHTGTQAAATISDLASVVKGYKLNEFAAPDGPVSLGNQRLTNLANATGATDSVPYGQLQTLISQAIAGQTAIKNPAKAVSTTNITLSGIQTIDGYSGGAGDRILVAGNTNAVQNGLYNMQSGSWTRAVDADEPAEWVEGTEILILNGTNNGGSIWRQTASGTITPGTTAMNFTQTTKINTYTADNTTITLTGMVFSVKLKPGGGLTSDGTGIFIDTTVVGRKGTATLTGDGTTQQFNITHTLNNDNPAIAIKDPAGIRVTIDATNFTTTGFKLTFGPNSIPANGQVFLISIYG